MRKWFILFAGVAALTTVAPAASMAQIGIDLPGVGVRIGEPVHRHYHNSWGYYDGPRVYEAPAYREREVYSTRRGCRTVTIQDDFGNTKQIRRCG
jgi:hypothetical protein